MDVPPQTPYLRSSMSRFLVPSLYLEWGLSHREPKSREWCATSGVHVHGHTDHGVPFLRGRAILIYLATRVAEDGEVFRGSLHDIKERFGVSWPIENLEKHFLRVVHAQYRCVERCMCAPARCRELQVITNKVNYCAETKTFRVWVSQDFYRSSGMGFWVDAADALKTLIQEDQLASLDLLI